MPVRKQPLVTNEYYHLFNRSVASERIFNTLIDLKRALKIINFYRFPTDLSYSFLLQRQKEERKAILDRVYILPPLVEIVSFSLMATHFHFVLRQLTDNGIKRFATFFQNSYAKYFNIKKERHGPLFSSRFKAKRIETEEQLFHVIRYTELNPVAGLNINIDDLSNYPYTSFASHMGNIVYPFVSSELIFNHFKDREGYKKFVFNQAEYQRSLKDIEYLYVELI